MSESYGDETDIFPRKQILKSIKLNNPNPARFELLFSTKASKFEHVHCLVPLVPLSISGILLPGISGTHL